MKKGLSLFVASSMVVSMFAGAAYAADKTPGEVLNDLGVIQGNGTDLKEDQSWARQDVVVLLSRLLGEEAEAKATAKGHTFTDVSDAFYDGFITWAVEEGLVEGKGEGKFGFKAEMKNQEFFAVVLRAFGVDTKGDKYAEVPALAIELGLATEATDMAAIPTRGETYATIVTALNTEIPGTGQTLGEKLGLIEVVDLAVGTVAQTGKGEITVNFNKAATDEEKKELTFTVENGLVKYPVTAKYAEDNKSVVLSSTYLPAGTYSVTVGSFDAKQVTVADEAPAKIEIGATSLQKAAGQSLNVKLYNQFGKEIANPSLNVTVYNATKGLQISADVNGKYDLSNDNVAKVDDNVVVTVTHSSGLSDTKTFKVVAGSAATKITLGTIAPLKDKTRITAGDEGLVVPVGLTDQYGTEIKLAETAKVTVAANGTLSTFTISGITFMLSQDNVVSSYAVDKDGVLTIGVKKAATLVVNAVNPTTGATGTTSVKIEDTSVIKNFQINNPGVLVVAGEEVKIPYVAVDQFNGNVAAKDIKFGNGTNEVNVTSNVAFAAGYPKVNGKGELLFKFDTIASDANAYVYAYVNGAQVGQLQLAVKKSATAVKVNGVTSVLTTLTNGAQVDFNKDKVTFLDNYNRTKTVSGLEIVDAGNADGTVELSIVSGDSVSIVSNNGVVTGLLADTTKTGVTKFKAEIKGLANSKFEFDVNVVKVADVKSYEIKSVGTIFGGKINEAVSAAHAKTIQLVGKINSTEVALVQDTAFDFVTTSDTTKVSVNNKTIQGVGEGTATITAYKGSTKLAETTVTVSTVAPVATKVEFGKSEYSVADGGTLTFTANTGTDYKVAVKDQYGVDITVTGFLTSSDAKVASVNGLVVTAEAPGQATLTYITSNNVTGTAVIVVN